MKPPPDTSARRSISPEAEDVFAEFLLQQEGEGDPERSFESVLRANPALESELRSLEADWRVLEGIHEKAFSDGGSLLDDLALRIPGAAATVPSRARELFAGYLLRRRSGEAVSFEEFCKQHPEDADELRALDEKWSRVEKFFLEANVAGSLDTTLLVRQAATALGGPGQVANLLKRLVSERREGTGYGVLREVARGGMGAILQIWDPTLRRNLAMKVITRKDAGTIDLESPEASISRPVARFLEEAQVTGQLDHPGIVPVHELGVDAEGRAYFTMRLVRGRHLGEVFEDVLHGRADWSRTRVLHVMLKVCEALAYAHSKGVVHRDLKPANVMVGRFGETYVMDWGLARVRGREDDRDLRLRDMEQTIAGPASIVETDRKGDSASPVSDGLVTMDGEVVGTPAYMAPEQARGELRAIGPASDVYSVGAMLYHLLAGHPPYVPPDELPAARTVLKRVLDGPPASIVREAAEAPVELVAICEMAMEREQDARYADMTELAEDLRAFLEQRVVRAYRTGPVAELSKWVLRNRLVAGLAGGLIVTGLGGLAGLNLLLSQEKEVAVVEREEAVRELDETSAQLVGAVEERQVAVVEKEQAVELKEAAVRNEQSANLAKEQAEAKAIEERENAERVARERDVVAERNRKILRLSNVRKVQQALAELDRLPPALPSSLPELVDWIAAQRELAGTLQVHREELQELRQGALPRTEEQLREDRAEHPDAAELHQLRYRIDGLDERELNASERAREEAALPASRMRADALEQRIADYRKWTFAEPADDWRHELLTEIVAGLDELERPGTGTIARAEARAALARSVGDITAAAGSDWDEATRAIADVGRFPVYAGLKLDAQEGLVPLGELRLGRGDDEVALYEFWHVPSGARPQPGPNGHLVDEDSGVVMVLIPGGTAILGSEPPPRGAAGGYDHYDEEALVEMGPIHEVQLEPFFLSRYEVTQAQWQRWTGSNPSRFVPHEGVNERWQVADLQHPVEQVSWEEAHRVLAERGLVLPTEAQWEYACRAGTGTPWWTGVNAGQLSDHANLADVESSQPDKDEPLFYWTWDKVRDPFGYHAPVIALEPNRWGLFHMAGNVAEWCRDVFVPRYADHTPRAGDGLRDPVGPVDRVLRGGSYKSDRDPLRSAWRQRSSPLTRADDIGVRPTRALEP